MMLSSSNAKVQIIILLVAILVGIIWSPIPKRIGFYQWLFETLDPALIGCLPCSMTTLNDWGYTFDELYDSNSLTSTNKGGEKEKENEAYQNRLWGQTALVTGANSGTGYEISLALARLGVGVTMACRNEERCHQAAQKIRQDDEVVKQSYHRNISLIGPGMAIKTMIVELSSLSSVRRFCKQFLLETDDGDGVPMPLDMLFLNAGMGGLGPITSTSSTSTSSRLQLNDDGTIEKVFATNVVGHHLMYRLLEPSLKRNGSLRKTPPRIVLTSSFASYDIFLYPYKIATDIKTLNGVPGGDPSLYSQSKLAQIYWAKELTDRLKAEEEKEQEESNNNNVDPNSIMYVNAANIGMVNTNIWDKAKIEQDHLVGYVKYLIKLCSISYIRNIMWTSEEGALTLLYLGTAVKELQNNNIRGKYYHPQSIEMKNHPHAPNNSKETKELQVKLWNFLDELVQDYV